MNNRILTVVAMTCACAISACGPSNNDNASTNNATNTSNNGTDNNTSGTNNTSSNNSNNTVANNTNQNNSNQNNSNNGTNNVPIAAERAVAISADFATGESAWHEITFAADGSGSVTTNEFGSGDVGLSVGIEAVYVIDRNASQIQVLGRPGLNDAGTIDVAGAMSTNPQFAAEAGGKVYVPLYNAAEIAIASLQDTVWTVSRLDVSSYDTFDQNPEASAVTADGPYVLVVLQTLQDFMPVESSQLLVVDSRDDSVVGGGPVDLLVLNAQAGIRARPNGAFAVGGTGAFGAPDGGIVELLNPADGEYLAGEVLVGEDDLGGDLLDFAFVAENAGFAVIMLADFSTKLVRFEISENSVDVIDVSSVATPSLNGIDSAAGGAMFVAGDTTEGSVGFGLYNADDFTAVDRQATTLPPADIAVLD